MLMLSFSHAAIAGYLEDGVAAAGSCDFTANLIPSKSEDDQRNCLLDKVNEKYKI